MYPTLSRTLRGGGPRRWPYPGDVAENTPVPLNRTERTLAFMIAAIGGISIIAIIVVIVTGFAHVDTSSGVWLTVKVLPAIGLPIALVLIIIFGVLSGVRRRRLNNGGN
jgi:hypothetical protein